MLHNLFLKALCCTKFYRNLPDLYAEVGYYVPVFRVSIAPFSQVVYLYSLQKREDIALKY
jgi:hypothetical protein